MPQTPLLLMLLLIFKFKISILLDFEIINKYPTFNIHLTYHITLYEFTRKFGNIFIELGKNLNALFPVRIIDCCFGI